MSRRMTLLAAVLLGAALAGCGANGGDPVARRQIPAADPAESDAGGSGLSDDGSSPPGDSGDAPEPGSSGADPAAGSGSASGDGSAKGSGDGGSGKGSGDDHARKTGLPKSIRIPEIGQQAFEQGVVAACGDKNGAPDCLTVRYETVQEPDHGCGFEWTSEPAKESTSDGLESIVPRGATLTAKIFTCPAPDESDSSAAPDDSAAPGGDGSEPAPEDPATTADPGTPTATP